MGLPENIKKIRKIAGLNQTDFAKEIGVSTPASISDYEKGKAKPIGAVWLAIEYRFGHLFQWVEKKDGTKYVEPLPRVPSLDHEAPSESATTIYGRGEFTCTPDSINVAYHRLLERILTWEDSTMRNNVRDYLVVMESQVEQKATRVQAETTKQSYASKKS